MNLLLRVYNIFKEDNMESREQPLRFLTLEGKIIIPFFQRTYVWKEENWEELFNELSKDNNTTNFLGTIILKQLPSNSGESKKLEVIDGQQRLTTISVLLKVLLDNLSKQDKSQVESDIKQILFFKPNIFDAGQIRIEHSRVDKDAYEQVINGTINIQNINETSHKILLCYKYFNDRLLENQLEKNELIIRMLKKLLDANNKMLVVIDLRENDDEQKIFDTLNTAGVRLTAAEIIKNSLFKKFIELAGKDEAIKFYKITWEKTFLNDQETSQYWEKERQVGRLRRDNIDILLHSIAVIEDFYDPDKYILSDLFKLYKAKISEFNDVEALKVFVNDIMNYARIYREKIIEITNDTLLFYDDGLNRLLHILDTLEISTFHPFILYVLKNFYDDQNTQRDLLLKLEKFVVRNLLLNEFPTKNYNKLCKQLIMNWEELNDKLNELPIDDCIRGIKNINNKNANLLLFWIELYRHSNDYYDMQELKYDYSLEHIMPQSWQEHWNFEIVPHPNYQYTDEQKKLDRNEKIYWLGNMTLLKGKLNTALRNYDFIRKMNGENRKKGIIAYADLSITKDDIVAPFNSGDKVWNESKIENRTNSLFEEIKKIWG